MKKFYRTAIIKDITLWREKYLMENLVTKRIKTLKTA